MEIKIGNTVTFDIAIRDSLGALITDLATAVELRFMIKENATDADANALVSKTLGHGVTVNTPETGYVRVVISPSDTKLLTAGEKYVGLQIEYSSTNIIEVNLKDNNAVTDKITLGQDVVRGS